MGIIKKYRVVIIILVPLLILVIIRSVGINHFKLDAKKLAEPSVSRTNLINSSEMAALSGEVLLINLGDGKIEGTDSNSKAEILNIPPVALLEKSNLNKISKHNGPVLIFSPDPSVSSRMWMLLGQMGIKTLYILTNDKDNESFKNKFRPDTLTGPEL